MNNFSFSPLTGLRDVTAYPSEPTSEAAAREQFQGLLDQVKTYLNSLNSEKVNASDYLRSFNTNGYVKLPNGLFLQWGSYTFTGDGSGAMNATITFPISFPGKCLAVLPQNATRISTSPLALSQNINNFTMYLVPRTGTIIPVGESSTICWFAIGF